MAVETDADLAGMFDADEFAENASYVGPAGGAGVSCAVIADRGQGRETFAAGESRATGSERHLWVRKTADGAGGLSEVKRDGVFTMLDQNGVPTGEVFKVAGLPKLDHIAHLWSAELVIGN